MNDKKQSVGLWKKTSKKGKDFLAGSVTKDDLVEAINLLKAGKKVSVLLFQSVSDNPKAPVMNMMFKEDTYEPKKSDDDGFGF